MKVSGKEVADAIAKKLGKEIKSKNLHPSLAIILANKMGASRIYVNNKIKTAKKIGIDAKLYEFKEPEQEKVLKTMDKLNEDLTVHGIIIQYPVYESWDFDKLESTVVAQKDVDGFRSDSPYDGATALAVWEMLTAFALIEGFKKTEEFLKNKPLPAASSGVSQRDKFVSLARNKKIVVVGGRGKTAGGPTTKLLQKRGFDVEIVDKETPHPEAIIKTADVVISATGVKNIINKNNLKRGAYVIGVGVGKEMVDGQEKVYGDIKEDEVSKMAKLYCPTIGGIGPLTIVSLLKNVVESAKKARN